MNDPDERDSLQRLGKRIDAAKEERERRLGGKRTYSSGGLGLGLRIATELVAAIGVSVAIGIGLDRWLGTQPWLLILFFILGAAAGFHNVVRVATNYDEARRKEREAQQGADPHRSDRTGDEED